MKILREECHRALSGRTMRLCLLVGLLLVVGQGVCFQLHLLEEQKVLESSPELAEEFFPNVLYESYLGGEGFTFFWELYLSLFPILAVMPFAGSFYQDIEGGYIKNLCSRVSKEKVLFAKYIAVFVSGAIAVIFPLIVSMAVNALWYPAQSPNALTMRSAMSSIYVFSEYYYTHPMVYHVIYFVVLMLFGGVLASLSLLATYYLNNILLVLFVPYLFYTAQDLLFQRMQLAGWSIKKIINSQDNPVFPSLKTWQSMSISFLVLFVITFFGFLLIGWKRDCIAWKKSNG